MASPAGRHTRRLRRSDLRKHFFAVSDEDPLTTVANLFDVSMMFAVAFMILATFSTLRLAGVIKPQDDITILKNPGTAEMEIIRKEGIKLERYRMSQEEAGGSGERLGICYRLPNGDVIYVPEAQE